MKSAFTCLFILLGAAVVSAKEATIGIYGLIDRVTLDPDGAAPNTVKISGWFVAPVRMSSGEYGAPQHGTLYLRLPPGQEYFARQDWEQLKKIAGSGRVVGFGQYWVANPNDPSGNPHRSLEVTVIPDGQEAQPGVYPEPRGIAEHGDRNDPHFEEIAVKLREAAVKGR